jgi:hypothetical protein
MQGDDDIKKIHHRNGPDTERAAAETIFPHVNKLQAEVLQYARSIWPLGFTQQELAIALGSTAYSTHRSRVGELMRKKLLEDTGVRRATPPSKRMRVVWRYKPVQLPLPFDGGANAEG